MVDIKIIGDPEIGISEDRLKYVYRIFFNNMIEIEKGNDGYPSCIIFEGNGVLPLMFKPENDEYKNKLKRVVKAICKELDADFAVFVVSAWIAVTKDPDYSKKMRPINDPNRQEALTIMICAADGRSAFLSAAYTHKKNKVIFEKEAKWINSDDSIASMISAWR